MVSVASEPLGFVEGIVAWFGRRAAARAKRTGRPPGTGAVAFWLVQLWGTVGAFTAFTVAAFLYVLPVAGFVVLGVSLLVVEAKVSSGLRARREALKAAHEQTRAVEPGPMRYR